MSSPVHSQHSQHSQHRLQNPLGLKNTETFGKFLAAKNRSTFLKRASLISIFVLTVIILADLSINQGSFLKTFLKNPMKMNHFIKNPFTITTGVVALSLLGCAISTKDKNVKFKEFEEVVRSDFNYSFPR